MKRWRPLTWLLLSIACLLGSFYFWRLGNEIRSEAPAGASSAATADLTARARPTPNVSVSASSTVPWPIQGPTSSTNAATAAAARAARFKYRLTNTTNTLGRLARSGSGILLENALIDTSRPLGLSIPDNLRAQGDPGTYIVQARGPVDDAFRAALKQAGADVVSYIPNNAYLVRASANAARQLSSNPQTQAVLPYEPYYKLSPALLASVMQPQGETPVGMVNVVVFPDAEEAAMQGLQQMGVTVVAEGRSPFGPVLTVEPGADGVPAMARLPGVQIISLASQRAPANDLTRAAVGVAADSVTQTNYLNLSGSNVLVAVNDSGVDATHPDLFNRVFSAFPGSLTDTSGHGTHVAGTIAGSGSKSTTVTNAIGSIMPGTTNQFRGMAPGASLYSQPLSLSDFALQEGAARTNALISNNSWNYGNSDYDIFAASYDAATRDALPQVTGSQPVLFVFAAGDGGGGDDNGLGGDSESIQSPATAKNVITVGSIEQPRGVTNNVVVDGQTNQPWAAMTDSDDEVAGFSARGNVGIGFEGDFGRFKPDVIAPGVFLVSTRSQQWDTNAYYNPTNYAFQTFTSQTVTTNLNRYNIFVPPNAVQLIISIANIFPTNVMGLPIYVHLNNFATTNDFHETNRVSLPPDLGLTNAATWFYSIGNPTNVPVQYDVTTELVTTNDNGNYYQVLQQMNDSIGTAGPKGPWYRYETGTSMSAAAVSGLLALLDDYFTNTLNSVPSPALLKAMLINGSRPVNTLPGYDFQVNKTLNIEGWGVVNLTNCVPVSLPTNAAARIWNVLTNGPSPILLYDQDPTNALATGDSRTIFVKVDPSAQTQPLRATLVWTDPPGNPVASIKLVNNLALVVTNLDDPNNLQVYYGNDIGAGANFVFPGSTNSPNIDVINNVQNVYLAPNLGTNYSITVMGWRVNVNAVTANPNKVAQDYALVISSDSQSTNAFTIVNPQQSGVVSVLTPNVTGLTNEFASTPGVSGQLLAQQHVGANSPFQGTATVPLTNTMWGPNGAITLGVTNQWRFYIITNNNAYTNAAFVTFVPVNLSSSRMGVTNVNNPTTATRSEADIDLYATQDSGLTNLNPVSVAGAYKSVGRGGTEFILLTNAQSGIYYVGVKSEDQQSAEYSFLGAFSLMPFGQNGGWAINVPQAIPDGSPALPGVANVIAISANPMTIRRVVVTNIITHQNFGDLQGTLTHDGTFTVLNNHTFGNGALNQTNIYEDNGENNIPGSQHTDGPGTLTSFIGSPGQGVWMLTEADTALTHTGTVDNFLVQLDPEAANGANNVLTTEPNSFTYLAVDVPPQATNLTIRISSNPAELQLYVRRGALPTQTTFDYTQIIDPPGGALSISTTTLPPLQPGRYFIGVFNPSGTAQTYDLSWILGLSFARIQTANFTSGGPAPILDDAVSYSSIAVTGKLSSVQVAQAAIAVAINHPRISDLVLTLISPIGQRLVLMENRGGPNTANLGTVTAVTNFLGLQSAGGPTANTNVISGVPASGVLVINYNFFSEPDTIDVYYNGADIFSPGPTSGVGQFFIPFSGVAGGNITIIMNQNGNSNSGTLWNYTPTVISQTYSYFTFTDDTNYAQVPIKFAIPPFFGTPSTTNFTLSDFEPPIVAGIYTSPTNVDGWSVDSNQVQVVVGPTLSGTQLLRLLTGTISRVLPTRPGDQYTLSFSYIGTGSATVTVPGISTTTVTGTSTVTWQTNTLSFTAGVSGTPLQIAAVTLGLRLDSFTLTDVSPGNLYYLPEEPLQPLVGDSPLGKWTLEVRDDRAGAASGTPPPEIVSWQMQFIFATNTAGVAHLSDGMTVTDSIPACQFAYFTVDVPSQAAFATNVLVSAIAPVNVWFNQTTPPVGANPPDFELLTAATAGSVTLFTNGTPPLIPGQRYYLAVQNPCGNGSNVTVVLRVDFGAAGLIDLTNMVPYTNANSGIVNLSSDHYHFYVPPGAVRAQFEIDNPSGDMTLAVREGLPLPDTSNFDYISANPGLNDELIVVLTNSTPVPLIPGNWYLTAINVSGGPVSYSIEASWWPTTGQPISVTGGHITGSGANQTFCITWSSLQGVHYFIQGVTNLGPGMTWTTLVQDVVGDPTPATTTTYCIPLPSPYQFFRVGEGLILNPPSPVVTESKTVGGFLLKWTGPVYGQYQVQWTPTLSPPNWQTLPTIITSTIGQFSFLDDGTLTGGLGGIKFYRVLVLQ